MSFEGKTLTLKNVSPAVIFFSDRPQRIAGHIKLSSFMQAWNEGSDSFAEDPPNANLSTVNRDSINNVVVELINPRVSGDDLIYDIRVLEGEVPATGGMSSLFIDGLFAGGALRSGGRGAALGAIGGAIAGSAGADFLCYVTPSEHLRLPLLEDVKEGVIASRIAAHIADIAKGVRGAFEKDLLMAKYRDEFNWKEQIKLSIDPDKAEALLETSESASEEGCTMCGEFCAIKLGKKKKK